MTESTFGQCFILAVTLPISQIRAQVERSVAAAREPISTLEAERLKRKTARE